MRDRLPPIGPAAIERGRRRRLRLRGPGGDVPDVLDHGARGLLQDQELVGGLAGVEAARVDGDEGGGLAVGGAAVGRAQRDRRVGSRRGGGGGSTVPVAGGGEDGEG